MANTQLTQSGAEVQAAIDKAEKLPTVTGSDSGKILRVDSSGNIIATPLLYVHYIELVAPSTLIFQNARFLVLTNVATRCTSFLDLLHLFGFDETEQNTGVNRFANNFAVFLNGTQQISGTGTRRECPIIRFGYWLNAKNGFTEIYDDPDDPEEIVGYDLTIHWVNYELNNNSIRPVNDNRSLLIGIDGSILSGSSYDDMSDEVRTIK